MKHQEGSMVVERNHQDLADFFPALALAADNNVALST
jgi:hypothetical protein